MFKWRPKWWNTPITWGASCKACLWSIPISLIIVAIEMFVFKSMEEESCTWWYEPAKEKVEIWTDEVRDQWNEIFHK